jgi:hypothetical protein
MRGVGRLIKDHGHRGLRHENAGSNPRDSKERREVFEPERLPEYHDRAAKLNQNIHNYQTELPL